MGNKISLEDQLIDLRITSKQMQRSAKKCEKNEKAAINKLKKVSFQFDRCILMRARKYGSAFFRFIF